ncbi:MAG: hypothetical protein B6241_11795 [Spirochaetaceae bacterium 4572_59]|nr:MAG: hypothetical protein B6241_11795 [Spirochaetaceae bacterium 4572_59]
MDHAKEESLSEQVYKYLVDQIIKGVISYGDRLSIKGIAAELNVSTSPIRDAIKQLEAEQFVIVKPRSSCIVKTPSKSEILQVLEARKMIELHVARTIYADISIEELKPLEEIVERMVQIVENSHENPNPDDLNNRKMAYIELDREFHTTFCGLAKNAIIDKFYREINMNLSMSLRYRLGLDQSFIHTLEKHKTMLHYLKIHSADILNLLQAHLELSCHNIISGENYQELPD